MFHHKSGSFSMSNQLIDSSTANINLQSKKLTFLRINFVEKSLENSWGQVGGPRVGKGNFSPFLGIFRGNYRARNSNREVEANRDFDLKLKEELGLYRKSIMTKENVTCHRVKYCRPPYGSSSYWEACSLGGWNILVFGFVFPHHMRRCKVGTTN